MSQEQDRRGKKECLAIISDPSATDEERLSASNRLAEIAKWQATLPKDGKKPSGGYSKPYESRTPVEKTDYGKIPESLQKVFEEIRPVYKGYVAMAATLVDEIQPTLDAKTRGMAVSAAVSQLVNLRLVKTLAES